MKLRDGYGFLVLRSIEAALVAMRSGVTLAPAKR
jgi:hypothetical protein